MLSLGLSFCLDSLWSSDVTFVVIALGNGALLVRYQGYNYINAMCIISCTSGKFDWYSNQNTALFNQESKYENVISKIAYISFRFSDFVLLTQVSMLSIWHDIFGNILFCFETQLNIRSYNFYKQGCENFVIW